MSRGSPRGSPSTSRLRAVRLQGHQRLAPDPGRGSPGRRSIQGNHATPVSRVPPPAKPAPLPFRTHHARSAHAELRGGGEPGPVPQLADWHSGSARPVHARGRRRIGSRPKMGRPGLLPADRRAHAGVSGEASRPRRESAQNSAASFRLFGARTLDQRPAGPYTMRSSGEDTYEKTPVTQIFQCPTVTSRARGNFARSAGDLLILQECPRLRPGGFVCMNGLRPNLGRELHYLVESSESARKDRSGYRQLKGRPKAALLTGRSPGARLGSDRGATPCARCVRWLRPLESSAPWHPAYRRPISLPRSSAPHHAIAVPHRWKPMATPSRHARGTVPAGFTTRASVII